MQQDQTNKTLSTLPRSLTLSLSLSADLNSAMTQMSSEVPLEPSEGSRRTELEKQVTSMLGGQAETDQTDR